MATISERTIEILLPTGGKAYILPTNVKDVVTIAGSFIGGPGALKHAQAVAAELSAALLDAGAGSFKKEAFREGLAGRGAEIAFGASGTRISFSASCFPEDARFVIERIADAILRPHLPPNELAAEKTRMLTDLKEEANDTQSAAQRAILRDIYASEHPWHAATIADEVKQIGLATMKDLKNIVAGYGTKHFVMAIVGDVEVKSLQETILKAFGKTVAGFDRPHTIALRSSSAKKENILLKDKANADVVMGATLGFTSDHELYLPSLIATFALGGSFTSHLMQTVRERDGLTYGVRAQLKGFDDKLDGYFRIWGTFAPSVLMRGIDTLLTETSLFLKTGMTEEMLARIQEEIAGSYAVSLSTTGGLARQLVRFAEDDRPLAWIDEYPDILKRITHAQVLEAAQNLATLPLSIATAGSSML